MKILLCGKGGSGKSTIASLIAKNLATKGYKVLVVDTDESNYGLSTQLGMQNPKELMEQLGGKKKVVNEMLSAMSTGKQSPIFSDSWTIDEIPKECVSKKGGIYLLQIGKVKHYGEGCACPIGGISRDFVYNLQLGQRDVVIIDTEAGIEHLGRGIESGVDIILMVLDPSYESIKLSQKVQTMANEANKSVYFILNKIQEKFALKMLNKMDKTHVIAQIPFDESIQEKGLAGEELDINVPTIGDITTFVTQTAKRRTK
ncbi:MAG: P-loop NTPase, partial [Petrotogales bacterium]